MDREKAKKIISGIFDEAADDIDTERLEAMRREIVAQSKVAQSKGLYEKMEEALDTEIRARSEHEAGYKGGERIHPQTPEETRIAGGPEDEPGEMRHGVSREASMKWRVRGR